MQHTGTEAVTCVSVLAQTVANPDVATRDLLQHEGKVLGPHSGRHVIIDVLSTHNTANHVGAKSGL